MLSAIELFPWTFKFDSNEPNMSSLLQHMKHIISNVSSSINGCYDKPLKAALLKESISQALIWIFLSYKKLPKDENPSVYLESMSDLLAMYIDMELRASKRGQEQFSAISDRLIYCLQMYLENSIEHMLDTLIKLRHMSHLFCIILDPIMKKVLKSIPPTSSKTDLMYVRYLLFFRLWKMINSDLAEKKLIRQTAITHLGSSPPTLPEFLLNYVRRNKSGSQIRSTQHLMKHKFDVKSCCIEFLNFCKGRIANNAVAEDKINCLERIQDVHRKQMLEDIIVEKSSSIIKSNSLLSKKVIDLKSFASLVENNAPNLSDSLCKNSINNIAELCRNQSIKKRMPLVKRKVKKSSDIIIIDITDEDSTPKITRKKIHKSFSWMEGIKRKKSEIKERREVSAQKSYSFAKDILESLILVTEDSEQKRIDCNLLSSFESWIASETLEPTLDIGNFFGDDVVQSIDLSSPSNIELIITEDPITISSPNLTSTLVSESVRVNFSNANCPIEVINNEIQLESNQEVSQDSRFETCRPPLETDSMISDSNEKMSKLDLKTETACKELSTMVLNENDLEFNTLNCSENMNVPQLSGHSKNTAIVSSFEEIMETSSSELHKLEESGNNYSKDVDYTLQEDKSSHLSILNVGDILCHSGNERSFYEIQDTQFHENTDALSVLATVCAAQKGNSPSKIIKVKDYAYLRNSSSTEIDPNVAYKFSENPPSDINRIVNIYSDDAFDKVALQVEVISASDGITMENISQTSRDTSNAILNGETVVLMQKSPNSNVYVINKASENKNSDDESFEDAAKGGELCQEVLCSETLSRGLMVKTEVEEKILRRSSSLEDIKKSSIDVNITKDKRKTLPIGNLSCRQNVKQEYNISNRVSCACGIPGCSVLSHDLTNPQIPLHMPAAHSSSLPSLYGNFSSTPELCMPYHKHCNTMPRGLPVNPPTTLHSHTTTNSTCGRSHCPCLTCAYEVVAHCRQCIHPTSESHSSYIESKSYFIPSPSPVQTSAVQELERAKDSRVANLYEDKLLYKLEHNLLESKPLEDISIKFNPEIKYQVEINNKLPLKKRLKAFNAVQNPYDLSLKMKNSNNYPGTPMMSIANLEVQASSNILTPPDIGATVELTTAKEDSSPIENRHYSGEIIRREYRHDGLQVHNHGMDTIRENSKDQKRLVNSQLKNIPLYHDPRYQRDIKSSTPMKDAGISSLKRLSTDPTLQEKPAKKMKKSTRQTRSSQRNVPKVNYNYTEVDPEWNPSGDIKRKRKKTSR